MVLETKDDGHPFGKEAKKTVFLLRVAAAIAANVSCKKENKATDGFDLRGRLIDMVLHNT